MADATKPGPSIQSMIDKAVSARLKKIAPSNKGGAKKVSRTPRHNDYPPNEFVEKFGQQEGEEERDAFSQNFGYTTEAIFAEGRTSSSSCNEKRPQTQQGQRQRQGQ